MLKLKFILLDNEISLYAIADLINIQRGSLIAKFNKQKDFTISELEIIKRYLVDVNIIDENFDIGEFLDECQECEK